MACVVLARHDILCQNFYFAPIPAFLVLDMSISSPLLTSKLNDRIQMDSHQRSAQVLYISSYVPRKCGIATFSKDLAKAVNQLSPENVISIVAMKDDVSSKLDYPDEVKLTIHQNSWSDYQRAIKYINSSKNVDIVCLQHEFGIYGRRDGEMVVKFIRQINKPILSTLHTVIPAPSPNLRKIIRQIYDQSSFVVVMLEAGARILAEDYGLDKQKIIVIPHGVPQFQLGEVDSWKQKLGLDENKVMSSVNLLSASKGIEYAINSLPEIIKEVPNFIYLVVGETHPGELAKSNGVDGYRDDLIKLSKRLKVEKNVRFINEYVSLDDLIGYVSASDFYITPYVNPQQITSGSLAYAIGAGKVCISTPYLYAKEMLGKNKGILVPFKGSKEIAGAVIEMVKNPDRKRALEIEAYRVGKNMTWDRVGGQYLQLFNKIIRLNQGQSMIKKFPRPTMSAPSSVTPVGLSSRPV